MLDIQSLKDIFVDKLNTTKSLDAAFTKAVWVAYKQGILDGTKPTEECVVELEKFYG